MTPKIKTSRFHSITDRIQKDGYSVLVIAQHYSIAVDDDIADILVNHDVKIARSPHPPHYFHLKHDQLAPRRIENRSVRLADFIMGTTTTRDWNCMSFPANPADPGDHRRTSLALGRQLRDRAAKLPQDLTITPSKKGFTVILPDGATSEAFPTPEAVAIEYYNQEEAILRGKLAKTLAARHRVRRYHERMVKDLEHIKNSFSTRLNELLQTQEESANQPNP